MRASDWAALALLTAAGAVLRLAGGDDAPLWVDEALTLVLVRSDHADLFLGGVDPTGGLYYALHKLFVADGAGLVGIRSVSLACGTLLIPVLFAAARSAAGPRAGLAAAALAAVFPPLVDYSQEARAYALLLLLIGLSAWGLIAWGKARERRHLILFVAASALAIHTHPTALMWAGPAVLWLLLRADDRRGPVLAAAALLALACLPELLRILRYAEGGGMFAWLGHESPAGVAQIFAEATLPLGWERLAMGAGWAVAFAVVAWIAWRFARSRDWFARNDFAAAAIAILLAFPLTLWIAGAIGAPLLIFRTALPAAIGMVVLLAILASGTRKAAPFATQLGALMVLYGGALLAGGSTRPAEPWDSAARLLTTAVAPGDAVFVCPSWRAPPLLAALEAGDRPLAAPVLLAHRGKVHQVPVAGWRDSYHQRIFAADWPAVALGGPAAVQSPLPFRRLWLLDSECVDAERRAIARWAGEGKWRRITLLPASERRADIAITLFEPSRPLVKSVLAPARRRPFRTGR